MIQQTICQLHCIGKTRIHVSSWVLMRAQVLMGVHGRSWLFMRVYGSTCVFVCLGGPPEGHTRWKRDLQYEVANDLLLECTDFESSEPSAVDAFTKWPIFASILKNHTSEVKKKVSFALDCSGTRCVAQVLDVNGSRFWTRTSPMEILN